jgi:hypothetical protein
LLFRYGKNTRGPRLKTEPSLELEMTSLTRIFSINQTPPDRPNTSFAVS